jgi:hypothetical protein
MKAIILCALALLSAPLMQARPLARRGGMLPAAAGGGAALTINNVWKASDTVGAQSEAITVSPTTGHWLVVCMVSYQGSHANHAVTDNIGGATGWSKAIGFNDATSGLTGSIWAKQSIPAGITTITCNGGASGNFGTAFAHDVSGGSGGVFTSGESSSAAATGTNPQTGTATNATAAFRLFRSRLESRIGQPGHLDDQPDRHDGNVGSVQFDELAGAEWQHQHHRILPLSDRLLFRRPRPRVDLRQRFRIVHACDFPLIQK